MDAEMSHAMGAMNAKFFRAMSAMDAKERNTEYCMIEKNQVENRYFLL